MQHMQEFHTITLQQQEQLSWTDEFKDQIIMWSRCRHHMLTGIPYNSEVPPDRSYITYTDNFLLRQHM